MKKYILSSMILSGLMFASCNLDETPLSKFDESEAFQSSTLIYVNTVANVYSSIGGNIYGGTDGIQSMNLLTSDMAFIPGRQGDWVDGGKWQNLTLHNFNPSQDMFTNNWNHIYSIIGLCNSSIEKLENFKSTNPACEDYIAELRALRAIYYYFALDNYGNVPIVVSASQSVGDVAQSSRSEVFAFVVKELTDVLPSLSEEMSQKSGEYYGRITKGIVYECLAKLAINAPVYTTDLTTASSMSAFVGNLTDGSASETLGSAISAKGNNINMAVDGTTRNCWETAIYCADKLEELGYELENNYSSNFAVANETSSENIFVRPNDDKMYMIWDCNLMRSWDYTHAGAMNYSGWNGPCATVRAMNVMGLWKDSDLEKADPRLVLNYYTYKDYADECGIVADGATDQDLEYLPLLARVDYNTTMQKAEGWSDTQLAHIVKCGGARMKKYEFDATSTIQGDNNNDLVIWRYADAVLMKAEAQYRLGRTGEALATLNTIRARVGATPKTTINLNTILDERMMEFAWEDSRRTDQVRFATWTEPTVDRYPNVSHNASAGGWNQDTQGYTCVFPIPQAVLDLNTNLKQNPGY